MRWFSEPPESREPAQSGQIHRRWRRFDCRTPLRSGRYSHAMAATNQKNVVTPSIRLRLAGAWADNDEIMAGLSPGFRIVAGEGLEQWLELPDGRRIEYSCSPRDVEFLAMFKQRCSPVPPPEERAIIERHTGVVSIEGPGGSKPAAFAMAQCAAAFIEAGAACVYCESSSGAMGAKQWWTNTENSLFDGLFENFVVITAEGGGYFWSCGMHALGCRDGLMPARGHDFRDAAILKQFLVGSYKADPGFKDDVLLREGGAVWRLKEEPCDRFPPGHPQHNPYGCWHFIPVENPPREMRGP
jgi:hypothetical protein